MLTLVVFICKLIRFIFLYDNPGAPSMRCCDKQTIITDIEVCCDQERRPSMGKYTLCCGKHPYDSSHSVCCGGKDIFPKADAEANLACSPYNDAVSPAKNPPHVNDILTIKSPIYLNPTVSHLNALKNELPAYQEVLPSLASPSKHLSDIHSPFSSNMPQSVFDNSSLTPSSEQHLHPSHAQSSPTEISNHAPAKAISAVLQNVPSQTEQKVHSEITGTISPSVGIGTGNRIHETLPSIIQQLKTILARNRQG